MLRHTFAAAVALVLLTACGGGSDGAKPSATPTAPPYTLEEMSAALPAVEDIEDGLSFEFQCPKDAERCAGADPATASVLINVQAATPELTELHGSLEVDVVYVQVRVDGAEDEAASEQAERRKAETRFEGTYDIPRKNLKGKNYTPGEKGEGEITAAQSGDFRGFRIDRTSTSDAQGKFVSSKIDVRSGTAAVTVNVLLGADRREIGDARVLADRVLADVLNRLG